MNISLEIDHCAEKPAKSIAMENYRIILANPDIASYQEAITALWKENLPETAPDRFSWLYLRPFLNHPALTWLAIEKKGSAAVGIGSLFPRRLWIDGQELVAGVAVDFAVDRRHRVLGPAVKIQRSIVTNSFTQGFSFNYAYPNKLSRAIFLMVGYRAVGEVIKYFKLLKTERYLQRYIKYPSVARLLGRVIDTYAHLLDAWHLRKKKAGVTETLTRCDARFDALWERVKGRYPVMGEKTAQFLNWRYAASSYRFFCLLDQDVLDGFIVYTRTDDIVVVWDIVADSDDSAERLLLRFAQKMRREKASFISLSYFGRSTFPALMKKLNFISRSTERSFLVYLDRRTPPQVAERVRDRENMALFDGDLDLSCP